MGLTFSLLIIFLLFCVMMAGVLAFCLRERRRSSRGTQDATIDHSTNGYLSAPSPDATRPQPISLHSPMPNQADEDDDQRVAMTLFGSIFLGALLAIITGYLVFFREWNS